MRKPVVVLCPMDCEMTYLAGRLDRKKETVYRNLKIVKGKIGGYPVIVIRTLIGMVNAACAALTAIEKFSPRCVIIQGTAGGHDISLHKNDIVIGESLIELGSFITAHRDAGSGINPQSWEFPGEEALIGEDIKRVRIYESDKELLKIAKAVPYNKGRVVCGRIGSADIWNKEIDRINYLHDTLGTLCEEMEGYAVAQVCRAYKIPMTDIRVISNSELHPEEIFDKSTAENSQSFCYDFIKKLTE